MVEFLFLAHTHGFLADNVKLQACVASFSPDLVLHEQLQDCTDVAMLSPQSKLFQENKEVLEICRCTRLEGCDLKDFGLSDALQAAINEKKLTPELKKELEEVLRTREAFHIKRLVKCKENKVLVVLGAWHLRKGGPLQKKYPDEKYILVVDKDGKECLEPTQDARFSA